MGQPLRQRDLLLVAAGERAEARFDPGRADVERLDLLGGDFPLTIGLEQPARQALEDRN